MALKAEYTVEEEMVADVLGLIKWRCIEVGRAKTKYRLRGMGPTFERFYEWLGSKQLRRQSSDWPWYYFEFNNAADDNEILETWGQYFWEDDETEVDDGEPEMIAIQGDGVEEELMRLLNEEIMKEFVAQCEELDAQTGD